MHQKARYLNNDSRKQLLHIQHAHCNLRAHYHIIIWSSIRFWLNFCINSSSFLLICLSVTASSDVQLSSILWLFIHLTQVGTMLAGQVPWKVTTHHHSLLYIIYLVMVRTGPHEVKEQLIKAKWRKAIVFYLDKVTCLALSTPSLLFSCYRMRAIKLFKMWPLT